MKLVICRLNVKIDRKKDFHDYAHDVDSFGRRKKVWHSIYFKRWKIIQKRNGMAVKHNNLSLINRIYLVVVATKYRVERNIKKIDVKFQVSKNNMKFIRRIKK